MKRMLFNATQAEELRVAIVDGQKLIDLDIESAAKEQRKSNIYKGVITRIEPSLEACFVDYGADRHGFLPFKEVSRAFFQPGTEAGRARIQDALKEGQELIVQVDKDERGNKGAALTTYVSLAGRYLVLMPNNPRGGGVSRRVDGDERAELRDVMDQLEVPNGMSLIARTAAIGRQAEELQWDLNYLLQLWTAIDGAAQQQSGAFLIYLEGSLVIRAIRDYFQPDIGEILIDTDEVYEQARAFMGTVMPGNINRVKRYRDDVPLFSRFQIEHQIETAFARQVNLPSGGAIVIDHTEALVAVDVNSGRATKGSDIEETAFKTNQEAAEELARQLRLRDLGGLIVIDFIDMENQKNQREVENRLRDALRFDRARVQMGKISRFGLMELSRQRLRPALAETSYIPCPRCTGTGHIRSAESAALHILRILEEEAMKENTGAVHVQVPVDVATFLLNEKRPDIQAIELRHKVTILLIPNVHLETPAHTITRLRHDDLNQDDLREPSYKMVDMPIEEAIKQATQAEAAKPRQEAAIKGISPDQPAPIMPEKAEAPVAAPVQPEGGLFSKIFSWFRSSPKPVEPVATPEPAKKPREARGDGRRDGRRGGRNGNRRDEERGERKERPERKDRNVADKAPQDGTPAPNGERKERRPRGERKERGERQQPEAVENKLVQQSAITDAAVAPLLGNDAPDAQGNEEQGNRRRGRRGGRGRGERRNEADATPVTEALPATTELAVEPANQEPVVVVIPAAEPAVVAVEVAPPAIEQVAIAAIAEPVQAAEVIEAAPVEITETPAVEVQESPKLEAPTPVAAEPVNLEATLAESGLVMVQTTSATVAVAQAEAPAKLGRPRKAKPAVDQAESESLVMVETAK
ncbi:Rne/Rng family ribonuclease [Ferribacterium limneticum]|uniref:Rne/Rng family ribonuclease n=1 Tax=Ferribacterium limneticum TaxID=76259 RepID=UPI001CFB7733|nr:Rne/Rng family ribonuclease [Ferribacterium limneticum]UCV30147.1 Rne/Rng family ribonuclease [Ferribacterium limneticum]UCV34066.1 Rne/Rng family ribonuclease [Ferribacterium limneticum]